MRACWLKWVGRDWSISADYIWLNYSDANSRKTIVFVNLKTFLTENELQTLYDHVFFLKLSLLLLENKKDTMAYGHEHKLTVDLQFLEH